MQNESSLFQKNILLGITGSIAVQKTEALFVALKKIGANVKIITTQAAMQLLSEDEKKRIGYDKIFCEIFAKDTQQMDHITLAKWADVLLIAPASASILSRLAIGLADQLLSLTYLATAAPVFVAPAMNQHMWQQPSVQRNVNQLEKEGVHFLGPDYGLQACGDIGLGRMHEPGLIVAALEKYFTPIATGVKLLITAGPTEEAIDPVRYITNRSSGKMGYALARAFALRGASVCLVSGPTLLMPPQVDKFIQVESAQEMCDVVLEKISENDLFISAAAIADYRVAEVKSQKIKKTDDAINLSLIKNPDIIKNVRQKNSSVFIVGFALETENLLVNARKKLIEKKVNMIVANQFNKNNKVFGSDDNLVHLVMAEQEIELPRMNKQILADELVKIICQFMGKVI
jgi:phosphopantothenoylcysteine decarboxylase/phosphopantothenate--cysteine ligase